MTEPEHAPDLDAGEAVAERWPTVVFAALTGAALWWWRRRRRHTHS